MKKLMLFTFLLLLTFVSNATGQAINELPLYGGAKKTVCQKQADKEFVNKVVKFKGSHENAAKDLVMRGWQALSKGDFKTAIKRFNQAWLVYPENGEIYWGLAITQAQQGKFELAIDLYKKADRLILGNPRLLADYGYAIIGYAAALKNRNLDYLNTSDNGIEKLNKAKELDPQLGAVYFYLAVAKFNRENYKEAWNNVYLAKKHGHKTVPKPFLAALQSKMPDPKQ